MDKKLRNTLIGIGALSIVVISIALANDVKNTWLALIIIIALMAGRGVFALYQFEKTTDIVIKERDKALSLLQNPKDESFEFKGLSERVEECFYKVNEALQKNDIDIVKDYVTRKMYERLKESKEFKESIVERLKIVRTLPIRAIDKIGDNGDLIDIAIEYIFEDKNSVKETREEVWTFVKGKGKWIVSNVSDFKIGISIDKLEKI